ncbi:acetyltransferase [Arthrobacter sp. RIT-PI-e]|uniref:GNAT family N-acetyltransferase n=1 Tax=Arthrobacter sp. RIT-PI-e TaxID=1681197 RepID=UPI000676ACCA|nr:GNAT family N-acetyltransferase [Arthrobacter sp. RIT-PI-e]KNC20164.1 acetyltransferase [Arthrobacter sp. RIT-PI-e]
MPLHPSYHLVPAAPSLEDYLRLRTGSGLSRRNPEQGGAAIAGSWAFAHVVGPAGEPVGMGRVIGDGGWYFVVADMATLPEHQRRGVGGAVLDSLLQEIRTRAPRGAYVSLTADPPGRRLYESRGFTDLGAPADAMHLYP